jgi:hypothetical protein
VPSRVSKVNTACQMTLVAGTLVCGVVPGLGTPLLAMQILTVGTTLWSWADYIIYPAAAFASKPHSITSTSNLDGNITGNLDGNVTGNLDGNSNLGSNTDGNLGSNTVGNVGSNSNLNINDKRHLK